MLKTTRIILAILSIVAVTLLFVDFTGTAQHLWPWMAKIQFIPAVLSVNIVAILVLLAMTLLFGRIYCSVICPLGIFQDVSNWIRGKVGKKKRRKNRFKFVKAHTRLRLTVLTVFVILIVLGLTNLLAASIAGLIEPYSAYGRISTQIFAAAYDGINNALASWAENHDSYMFYRVSCAFSAPVLAVAIISLTVVTMMAWRGGRDYCNTFCPVGTILGYLSKYSLLKPVINTDKCINCGKCGRNCKAKCIDTKHHEIDYSRCVACMDCIGVCSEGAIKYTYRHSNKAQKNDDAPVNDGRRAFMGGAGFIVGALTTQAIAKTTDGGLEALKKKNSPTRSTHIVPSGSKGHVHLSQHCTACQLCIQACPNSVLKPRLSIDGFMQPEIDYTEGYCSPQCTRCSEVCPAGAIELIDISEKSSIKVGTAVVDISTCISANEGKKCGNCARHCPAGAIKMVPAKEDDDKGPFMPIVNDAACIGCGACEYYCPVGTVSSMAASGSAIHVEGVDTHRYV